jgi:hypothetical protein
MNYVRQKHTASVLVNGKVLVVGGTGDTAINTTELYDPVTEKWTSQVLVV